MTVFLRELLESRVTTIGRNGRASTQDYEYVSSGSFDVVEVRRVVELSTPQAVGSRAEPPIMWRQSIQLVPLSNQDGFRVQVRYDSTEDETAEVDETFEGDTTGGTAHVTQSLSTVSYVASGTPADVHGAIGVQDQGVEGIEVVVPAFRFSVTKRFDDFSFDQRLVAWQLTGKKNAAPFAGLNAGEVLFVGASFRYERNRKSLPWSVTYQFRGELDRGAFVVGDIPVPEKPGQSAMTTQYAASEDVIAGRIVRKPVQVDVHEIAEDGDFSLLGLDPPYD